MIQRINLYVLLYQLGIKRGRECKALQHNEECFHNMEHFIYPESRPNVNKIVSC